MKANPKEIRRSVIAGTWYPGTEKELRRTIEGYLAKVEEEEIEGEILALIAPHAGYIYSGQVAAYAYKQLEGKSYPTVAVISPVHRVFIRGFAVTAYRYYETPLGLVELDSESVNAIDEEIGLEFVERDEEHSLEIQLPFLQFVLGEFKLLPIMMGDHSLQSCRKLGDALKKVLRDKRAMIVASTDLSHFYPYNTAVRLDNVFLEDVEKYDPEGLFHDLKARKCEACGGGPVVAVMFAARGLGANRAKILKYANSGDVTGDRSQVVGYLSAALYRVMGDA